MVSSISSLFLLFLLNIATVLAASSHDAINHQQLDEGVARRALLSFKEVSRGNNVTFDCFPSGPCVPCIYSEKKDEKFRCSETGYRIPLTCVETKDTAKNATEKKSVPSRSTLETSVNSSQSHVQLHEEELTTSVKLRSLLDDSSKEKSGSQSYITYRSCIPFIIEEKLSVFGFEIIVFGLLLISASVIYFRKKRSGVMSGVATGRVQANPRF